MTELPERIRARAVALVADALPWVSPLPASLRRLADFAPTRRARLGGAVIWAALTSDADFRTRAATQVAARVPAAPSDAAEAGALAWLVRDEGWEETLADAVRRLAQATAEPEPDPEVQRLRDQVAGLQQDLRDLRASQKVRWEEMRSENATLRRRLGEIRSALRAAEVARTEAEEALAEVTRSTDRSAGRAEAEVRRLRAQLVEAQAERAADRREVRSEQDTASMRARYLLDTVIEAAAGLRRELALPPAAGTPGEQLESELLAVEGVRTPSQAAALGPANPAALEQLLALPKARLIVDGYNVSKAAWPASSLEAQRIRLLNALAPLAARTGAETTVVFDAAASVSRPVVNTPRGVKVVFSPPGVIADDVIRELVAAEPSGRVVVVVSSDLEVSRDVTRLGARPLAAEALMGAIGA